MAVPPAPGVRVRGTRYCVSWDSPTYSKGMDLLPWFSDSLDAPITIGTLANTK